MANLSPTSYKYKGTCRRKWGEKKEDVGDGLQEKREATEAERRGRIV
jgi:hypothetical protein